MPFMVTGSPAQAFIDVLLTTLRADATLIALVTGVYGHLTEAQRTAFPYIVLGRRHRDSDGGAMQLAGGHVSVQIDVWSAHKGASEAHAICSRIAAVLERRTLLVSGYAMVAASLTCEMEEVFDEPDTDDPNALRYHGVQRWVATIEESAA